MKSAVWVKWTEIVPLQTVWRLDGIELDRAEKLALKAKYERQLIGAVPVGNA